MSVRVAIRDLQASRIGEIVALGFGDPDIIPLWYGESDLPTPGFVGEAASAALARGETFYTYKLGLPELRQTLAEYLSGLHGKPLAAERIAVTSSGMTALMILTQALVDAGDNFVIVAPVWPISRRRYRSWAANRALSGLCRSPAAAGGSISTN